MRITYTFTFNTTEVEQFVFDFEPETMLALGELPATLPEWTTLSTAMCPHCSLDSTKYATCPLAARLCDIVTRFSKWFSYDDVSVEVLLPERTVSTRTTAQRAVSSMMGLVIPCSGCPHTVCFRPMARFHLPFSTQEETLCRASSLYLLGQFFREKRGQGGEYALQGLKDIYRDIEIVNLHVAKRLRMASERDSSVNAVILLDLFAKSVPIQIEDDLRDMEELFSPFLEV